MVYAIAAYHDTGLAYGRESHHIRSGEILLGDSFMRQRFTEEQMAVMRDAIEDHRASSDHAPRTIYGRIVAEADRCLDPETVIRRTIQYGTAHYPALSREGQFDRCVEHLQRKYAEGGYLRLWIPESDNASKLAGTACADSRHGTAARSLRADLRRGIPELIPGEGIPYYDSGNSRHRVRNPTCNGTQQGKTKRERKRPIPADPFKHNIPRRPQQISGEYFTCGCPQRLFGIVRKIFHILHALVHVAFGVAVIHPAAELAQRLETVALSHCSMNRLMPAMTPKPFSWIAEQTCTALAPHNSALTAASPSCTPSIRRHRAAAGP